MYTCFNGNLLFHGCVPMNEDGSFREVQFGGKVYKGREYFDYCDQVARRARNSGDQASLDFMWFLWNGRLAPTAGREFRTFEMMFLEDVSTHKEPSDPYFQLIDDEEICEQVLEEFDDLTRLESVCAILVRETELAGVEKKVQARVRRQIEQNQKVKKGETPIRGKGKALVIDGGFCRAYHKKTGISGYTLVSNSRSMRLLAHNNVADVRQALKENKDIESVSETVEIQNKITRLGETDKGMVMQQEINDLYNLLNAYQNRVIVPQY